jgi:hypothetical protein
MMRRGEPPRCAEEGAAGRQSSVDQPTVPMIVKVKGPAGSPSMVTVPV